MADIRCRALFEQQRHNFVDHCTALGALPGGFTRHHRRFAGHSAPSWPFIRHPWRRSAGPPWRAPRDDRLCRRSGRGADPVSDHALGLVDDDPPDGLGICDNHDLDGRTDLCIAIDAGKYATCSAPVGVGARRHAFWAALCRPRLGYLERMGRFRRDINLGARPAGILSRDSPSRIRRYADGSQVPLRRSHPPRRRLPLGPSDDDHSRNRHLRLSKCDPHRELRRSGILLYRLPEGDRSVG